MTILGRGLEWITFLLAFLAGYLEEATASLTGRTTHGYERGAHRASIHSDFLVHYTQSENLVARNTLENLVNGLPAKNPVRTVKCESKPTATSTTRA